MRNKQCNGLTPLLTPLWSVLAVILTLTGCQTQGQPRVMRLALNPDDSTWRLSVDGADHGHTLSSSKLTNEVTRLRPRWGDVLLLSSPPAAGSNQVKAAEGWLFRCCQSNRVAVNLTYGYTGVDMFSMPAYHWTAPFDNPFDLAKASFFCEGKLVGSGTNGFEKVLGQIASDRPKQVFILGSMYDTGRSFPPNASPYEKQRDQLYNVLKAAGTDFIELDPLD